MRVGEGVCVCVGGNGHICPPFENPLGGCEICVGINIANTPHQVHVGGR